MSDAPPSSWTVQVSRSTGRTYWFNSKTGASLYEEPEELRAAKRARTESAHPPRAPQPAADASAAAAAAVASAYDLQPNANVEERRGSRILHLKNLNNWIKAVLIAEYVPAPCQRVLDLGACGGRGRRGVGAGRRRGDVVVLLASRAPPPPPPQPAASSATCASGA